MSTQAICTLGHIHTNTPTFARYQRTCNIKHGNTHIEHVHHPCTCGRWSMVGRLTSLSKTTRYANSFPSSNSLSFTRVLKNSYKWALPSFRLKPEVSWEKFVKNWDGSKGNTESSKYWQQHHPSNCDSEFRNEGQLFKLKLAKPGKFRLGRHFQSRLKKLEFGDFQY